MKKYDINHTQKCRNRRENQTAQRIAKADLAFF